MGHVPIMDTTLRRLDQGPEFHRTTGGVPSVITTVKCSSTVFFDVDRQLYVPFQVNHY
jgi:hypothetical protein